RLAAYLREMDVGPEAPVALFLERSVDALTGILGILKAGGVLVPFDPAYPAERIADMARRAGIGVFVTAGALRDRGLLPAGRTVCLDADRERLAARPAGPPAVVLHPESAAYVIYTSGSTGTPKGVVVSHGAALSLHAALEESVYRGRGPLRVSVNAPLVFDGSVKQWLQLLGGHTLHVVTEEERLDPGRLLARVRGERVQVLDCTPTQLRGLFAAGLGAAEEPLEVVLCGGEALDPDLWGRLAALPGVDAFNVYGPTEFTVDATAARVRDHSDPTLGRPLSGARVHLLDDRLRPVPPGVAGELYLAGARLARGYLGGPALTAERFLPDPYPGEPGARMYRTGDLARWREDGTLEFLGRTDDQVKVRGVRVELGEIESLLREHPRVGAAAAAVYGSGGEAQIAAFFVPRGAGDGDTLAGELLGRLRERLPGFMVPAWVLPLASLPLTSSGKADRRSLPDPRTLGPGRRASYVAPGSELERSIARVWQEVLGVERVGVHDNFFDIGGNSLLIVQAYDRLRDGVGGDLTLVELFRYPTVTLLAERLSTGTTVGTPALSEAEDRARRQREALARQSRPGRPGRS
ncbi:MAG TPA: non-ribosomal peptide synthetase, partial [Longimicrobiaceae bacterium]|nr:non-ribosomal peptide synthetase [Longimicrobiaceae bacterium]